MIYYIGLIFVLLLILIGIDDLIWELYCFFHFKKNKDKVSTISYKELRATTPGLLAVVVAAYNEEDVLEEVIENLIRTNHYPNSMYHIFLGVYPNDPGTLKIAEDLSKRHENIHKIIHVLDGPSSKADNINNVIKNILELEDKRGIRFKGIVIHDSEDVVHPYEFLVENYLLNYHKAIQMPVFPLQKMPRKVNIFKNMISGTYADEFAENHYKMLVDRNATGVFVPSAGTGFVLSREIIDYFPDCNVFPVGSLTEDYKLSLMLKQRGFDLHYALEEVERLRGDGNVVREFIATRSIFPSTYNAAVRQKTRWIYGITMQSFKLREVLKDKRLSFGSKYSLYKDWKAKFGNILLGPGYLLFAYFILSLFFNIPTMYPKFSLSWYMMLFVSILMIKRQVSRGKAVKNVYGHKSAIISVLLPPILPFRMVVGNTINFHATVRAWKMRFFGTKAKKKNKAPKWSKTDHQFLEEIVLKTFKRNLGDILINEKLISGKELNSSLKKSKAEDIRLGEYLIKEKIVSEENIVISLCKINSDICLRITPQMIAEEAVKFWGKDFLIKNNIVPILRLKDMEVFAIPSPNDKEKIETQLKNKKHFEKEIRFIYSTQRSIQEALRSVDENTDQMEYIECLIENRTLSLREGLIALSYKNPKEDIRETLESMGFLNVQDL